MNAGYIPKNHWTQDLEEGGGRIIGEACHLFDVCIFITGSLIHAVCMHGLGNETSLDNDNASILLKFKNGSNGVVNYFSNGSTKYSKERIEIYHEQKTWVVDDFRTTHAFGVSNYKTIRTNIDKGHKNQFKKLLDVNKNGWNCLIPIEEIFNVTKATFAAIESYKSNQWVKV